MPYRDSYSDPDDRIHDAYDDDDSDADDDRDLPDASDRDDDDTPATVPCPYCRRPIPEDAELCPHCKSFISYEDAPHHHPWWLLAGVAVCLLIVLLWIL